MNVSIQLFHTTMHISLADLNQSSQDAFVAALDGIFEHTPAIAQNTWHQRPFASLDALHQGMVAVVQAAGSDFQLALIRAHPDLGSKAKMADASVQEQAGAGLDQLTSAEFAQFQALNQTYNAQFGFPFLIAVRQHTKHSILAAFQHRLQNTPDVEQQQALTEIFQIARLRLGDRIMP